MEKNIEKILEKMYYFTNEDVVNFVTSKNVNVYLDRYTKNNDVIRLKRGLYVSQKKIEKIKTRNKLSRYLEYITTNLLITPSYLSCEYVMAKSGILIENVYAITAITTKKTNKITNIFGSFLYRNVDEKLFWGYETKKDGDLIYFEAYPEKALLDWLWLKRDLILTEEYFKELRLELHSINFKRLKEYTQKYNKTKINKAFILLNKIAGL